MRNPSWRQEISVKKTEIEAKDRRVGHDPPPRNPKIWVHYKGHPLSKCRAFRSKPSLSMKEPQYKERTEYVFAVSHRAITLRRTARPKLCAPNVEATNISSHYTLTVSKGMARSRQQIKTNPTMVLTLDIPAGGKDYNQMHRNRWEFPRWEIMLKNLPYQHIRYRTSRNKSEGVRGNR
jgi:hypothetical protein